MLNVDLNCDMGEGYGNDAKLMEFVSSVNVACGGHAGDRDTMKRTVEDALRSKVSIGAHPGFPDRLNFGRKRLELSENEIFDTVIAQVRELQDVCISLGAGLDHVKPHGALYNIAASDLSTAQIIAKAVYAVNPSLMLYGLAGSELLRQAEAIGLKAVSEVFADRTYQSNGSLTPRSEPNALVRSVDGSAKRALQMVLNGTLTAVDGSEISVRADTICIHGDGDQALEFAQAIRTALNENQIKVCPPKSTV
jgi:UPF0271 protein